MKIAFLGLGSMNGAILAGLQENGLKDAVGTCHSKESAAKAAQRFGIEVYAVADDDAATAQAVAGADVVMVGVKPAQVTALLKTLTPEPGAVIVSVAAAVTLDQMAEALPEGQPLIRTMPNTPTQVGAGVIGMCASHSTSPEKMAQVKDLLDQVATTVVLPESQMDALTAISGSGPAYVFHFAEVLIAAGVSAGLDAAMATTLTLETIEGAAKMLKQPGADAAELRKAVTSPNGTTAAALEQLSPLAPLVQAAVLAARDRATEMSADLD